MEKTHPTDPSASSRDTSQDANFFSLIVEVLGDQPALEQEKEDPPEAPLWAGIWLAAKRFGKGAVSLGKAFFVSAATGQAATPTHLSSQSIRLHDEMKQLLDQLRWLEAGESIGNPDDLLQTPQREWAARTLAIAVRLKILQRAAQYCRLQGETHETSARLRQIVGMHNVYLLQFARLQQTSRH